MVCAAFNPPPVFAQLPPEPAPELEAGGPGLPQGLVLTPNISLSAFFDDNVFLARDTPQGSAGARVTGGLGLSKSGRRVSFRASYGFASDVFFEFPEIDDLLAAQSATVGLQYQVGRRTGAYLQGRYSMSRRPGDLFPETGLTFGRGAAETYSSGVGVTRQIGRDARLGFSYGYSVLVSAPQREVVETPSENWSVNVSKKVARRTTVGGSVGVSNIGGVFRPTFSVSLSHARNRISLGMGYSRGYYPLPTAQEAAETESLGAKVGWRWGRFSLSLSPRYSLNSDALNLVRSYSLAAGAGLSLGRWVSLRISYSGRSQRRVESAFDPVKWEQDLVHNTVYFGVAFSKPIRLR
jgi:hypothetical protein